MHLSPQAILEHSHYPKKKIIKHHITPLLLILNPCILSLPNSKQLVIDFLSI